MIKNKIKSGGPHSFGCFHFGAKRKNRSKWNNGQNDQIVLRDPRYISLSLLLLLLLSLLLLLLQCISPADWHCANGHTSWEIVSRSRLITIGLANNRGGGGAAATEKIYML